MISLATSLSEASKTKIKLGKQSLCRTFLTVLFLATRFLVFRLFIRPRNIWAGHLRFPPDWYQNTNTHSHKNPVGEQVRHTWILTLYNIPDQIHFFSSNLIEIKLNGFEWSLLLCKVDIWLNGHLLCTILLPQYKNSRDLCQMPKKLAATRTNAPFAIAFFTQYVSSKLGTVTTSNVQKPQRQQYAEQFTPNFNYRWCWPFNQEKNYDYYKSYGGRIWRLSLSTFHFDTWCDTPQCPWLQIPWPWAPIKNSSFAHERPSDDRSRTKLNYCEGI